MSDPIVQTRGVPAVEAVLGEGLAHGDVVVGTITPILRHLLASDDHSLFSDEIVARMRGMMGHLAAQLLDALDEAGAEFTSRDYGPELLMPVKAALADQSPLLSHLHALAVEWQVTERLQARLALDPVLSPMLQGLIAANQPHLATGGMALLAANARHAQAQRRMQLALGELPADLFHLAIVAMRGAEVPGEVRQRAEAMLRAGFDEGRSRLGLINRLLMGLGGGAAAALSVTHAGVALFASALALGSGLDRDLAVLATNETQLARLALALRAAGARIEVVEEQFMAFHPDISLPEGVDQLSADRAAALLARQASAAGR